MTETGPKVTVQPLVSWPRQVFAGESYLVTVDLRLPEAVEEWPYDQEEFIVGCMLDGLPACKVRAIGAAGVVLHRFGGTYGAARFIAEASPEPEDLAGAALWLTLTTEGGLPFYTGRLPLDGTPPPGTTNDQPVVSIRFEARALFAVDSVVPPNAVAKGSSRVPVSGVPASVPEESASVPPHDPEHRPFRSVGLPGGPVPEKRVDPWASWERFEGGEGEEALSRLGRELPAFFANSTLVDSHWSQLPFYAAHRLMELQFTRDYGVERAFVLHGPERIWWLNGKSNPIHEVNNAESLALTESTVADYLRFFLYFIRAENGAFVLIESADEVKPRADAAGRDEDQDEVLTLETARSKARPLLMQGSDTTGQWLVDATVAYGGALYDTSLAVGTGGDVDMTDDNPIGALDALTVPDVPSLEPDDPRLDDRMVEEYLRGRLGAGYPARLDIEAVVRLTYGVPLAVSLVAELLGGGLDQAAALAPVRAIGASGAVRELVLRYLIHARTIPALQPDRPLLYGLALLDDEADRPAFLEDLPARTQLDPEALAALWDVPAQEAPARLDSLAERHDFMLGHGRRLRQEVREPVLPFLLDPLERPVVRDMNSGAAALYRQRADAAGHLTVDGQLADQDWQTAVIALLWHTFWADLDQGLQLLKELFAAAVTLDDSFAAALLRRAAFFAPACTVDAQDLINVLQVVSDLHRVFPSSPTMPTEAAETSARDVIKALKTSPAKPLLATAPPAAVYYDLLQVSCHEALGLAAPDRATLLLRAASDAETGGATARAITAQVRQLAVDPEEYSNAPAGAQQAIVSALGLLTHLNPGDADAHNDLGNALYALSLFAEAETAYREALRLDPSNAVIHGNLWGAVCEQGRFSEAEAAYREALRLDSSSASAYNGLGYVLICLGRFSEAEAAYREALRLDSSSASAYSSLGYLYLKLMGRVDEAETALREALRLDPNWLPAHANLGFLYVVTGDLDAARSSFLKATKLAPAKHAFSELILGALDRSADPSVAEIHFNATLMALDQPGQPTTLTLFGRAEIQALAMAALDRGQEATAVLESAVSRRSGADVFQRQQYELFSTPESPPGINTLIAIWRDIIASDNTAAGPWGGPRTFD